MKVTRVLAIIAVLLLAVGLMAGCGGSDDTTTTAPATGDTTATTAPATGDTTATTAGGAPVTVKIGAAGPFTGDLAKIGTDALQAITDGCG